MDEAPGAGSATDAAAGDLPDLPRLALPGQPPPPSHPASSRCSCRARRSGWCSSRASSAVPPGRRAASALFVFAIGVALSFFLVPVVNWLVRHGVPRIGASILVVVALVVITLTGLAARDLHPHRAGDGVRPVTAAAVRGPQGRSSRRWSCPAGWSEGIAAVATTLQTTLAQRGLGRLAHRLPAGAAGHGRAVLQLHAAAVLPVLPAQGPAQDVGHLLSQRARAVEGGREPHDHHLRQRTSRSTSRRSSWSARSCSCIVSIGMFVIGTVIPDAEILVTFALLLGARGVRVRADPPDRADPELHPGAAAGADRRARPRWSS